MIDSLIDRIIAVRATSRLSDLLANIKRENRLKPKDLKATGTVDEICASTRTAIQNGHLTKRELARLVDEIEENGAQHILLFHCPIETFELIRSGARQHLTPQPPNPSEAQYTELPTTNRVFFEEKPGDRFAIKLVGKTAYWVHDPEASTESAQRKVSVWTKAQVRIVHMLLADPASGRIEIRIKNAGAAEPKKHWESELTSFLEQISSVITLDQLHPMSIWDGFGTQVSQFENTYMAVDEARDEITNQRISLRRQKGSDIRSLTDYRLSEDRFARDHLNIYWDTIGDDGTDSRTHTLQSKELYEQTALSKVTIKRHLSPEVLKQVLDEIQASADP